MSRRACLAVMAALGFFCAAPQAARAALYTSTLGGVTILGTTYTVTFGQYDGGSENNSFNAFFGTGAPALTFTTVEAADAAVNAILAALLVTPADVSPVPGEDGTGFRVPFAIAGVLYRYRTGLDGVAYPADPAGYFSAERTDGNIFSMATFKAVAVPAPPALGLFAAGLVGLAALRRRPG
jgi:hypothetical protein